MVNEKLLSLEIGLQPFKFKMRQEVLKFFLSFMSSGSNKDSTPEIIDEKTIEKELLETKAAINDFVKSDLSRIIDEDYIKITTTKK